VEGEAEAAAAVQGADRRRVVPALAALSALALVAPLARAAPTEVELRAARQLFKDAEKDEDAGRWSDALEKLRRVGRVKLTAGIRYHEALCEEHLGQLSRALDDYTASETQAGVEGAHDVLALVSRRLADLGPRVPRLTIRIVPPTPDGVVTLDGSGLSSSLLNVPIPVDPGPHSVEATAKNRTPAHQSVTLRERQTATVELELPEAPASPATAAGASTSTAAPPAPSTSPPDAAVPAPEPAPPAPAPAGGAPSHTGAWLATAGAVALAGGGIAAYLVAGTTHSNGVTECAQRVTTDAGACDDLRNRVRAWDGVAGLAWLGAAGVGGLAIVLFAHTGGPAPSARLLVGPGSFALGGRF